MSVIEYFKIITAIPRCSFETKKMKEKIIEIAKGLGYKTQTDRAGNILCQKGEPHICLQSHYDMVCLGDTSKIELVEKNRILKAKNSTLGADNGMGMAIMFSCMEKFEDLECLFTNDEEVGLVGASRLELKLHSNKLLNLDGEDEKEIYIGCAGGIDIVSKLSLEYLPLGEDEVIYEISVSDLQGGHSGVDIDKGIESATKLLAQELTHHTLKLLHVEGGELRNSIAKNAKAVVASCEAISLSNRTLHVSRTKHKREYIKNGQNIIKVLNAFSQGVRGFDKSLNIPSTSINLGVVRTNGDLLQIDCSARAMDVNALDRLANETESLFRLIGCETVQCDRHEPWTPNAGEFAHIVKQEMLKDFSDATLCAIHAGLECGIIMQRESKKIEAVAIGPTIRYPHSLREECDLDSVQRVSLATKRIIDGINKISK